MVVLLLVTAPVVLLLAGAYALHRNGLSTVERLMRDPVATMNESATLGAVSHIGVLGWAVTAGVCIFTAAAARQRDVVGDRAGFLFWAGLLSAVLCLDDLFIIHERLGPEYLGVPETAIYAFYATAALLLLVRFRATVMRTEVLLLLSAGTAMAVAIVVDCVPLAWFNRVGPVWLQLIEDGAKLLGICLWATYLIRTAAATFHRAASSARSL